MTVRAIFSQHPHSSSCHKSQNSWSSSPPVNLSLKQPQDKFQTQLNVFNSEGHDGFSDFEGREKLASAELGVFLENAHDVTHLRFPVKSRRHRDAVDSNLIYDIQTDPQQQQQQQSLVKDDALEARLAQQMRSLLKRFDAPPCQYERMGL